MGADVRHFVFRSITQSILQQAIWFLPLYAGLAIMHGVLLFAWTDLFSFDYRLGFLIAVGLQVIIGYIANKRLVFL
jgi:putative flippase GtrA